MPLALLTLLVTLAYAPWLPSAPNVGRWVVMSLGTAVLVWSLRVRWTCGHVLGAAFLLWCALGLYWTVSPMDTAGELWHWIVAGGLFMIAAEEPDLDRTLKALALGVTVSSLFALLHWAGYETAFSLTGRVVGQAPVEAWGFPGVWLSKNMAVEMAAVALVGAVGVRFWWGVPGPLLGVVLAGGREGALMLLVAAASWVWLKVGWLTRVLMVTVAGWGAFILVWTNSLGSGWTKLLDRLEIWQFTVHHLRPLGWGLHTFGSLQPGYEFSHNELLQYTFELGVGVVFMIGVVAYALTAQRTQERVMLMALLAASMVWFPLHAPGTVYVGVVLAGYLCGVRGRAVRAERGIRGRLHQGHPDTGALGIGALRMVGLVRVYLSPGPQPENGPHQVPGAMA